jgi:2-polyprenyl-3-methyl-5-hydroxy-6-metoxy-1,4-benzoquinol methylase
MDCEFVDYFKKCHLDRPIYTLKTSALLLYKAIKAANKPLDQIELLDYGAGVSTLYVLAKKIGLKKVYYSDLMQEYADISKEIDAIFEISMDDYIVGDIEDIAKYCKEQNYQIEIITSRNVIEHIYDLENYFHTIYKFYPNSIIYNSTTANWGNPIVHLQHIYIHYKNWKNIKKEKEKYVRKFIPISEIENIDIFLEKSKSLGARDFDEAIQKYKSTKKISKYKKDYTNISVWEGNWSERLMSYNFLKQINKNYNIEIIPGLWDENSSKIYNLLFSKLLNWIIKIVGNNLGKYISNYIFVVAIPKKITNK